MRIGTTGAKTDSDLEEALPQVEPDAGRGGARYRK